MTPRSSPSRARSVWKLDELLTALELSENGFMSFDANGRCVALNECAASVVRRRKESWLGKTIAEVAPESIGTPFEQAFQRCRREGGLVVIEKEYYPPHHRWYQSRFQRTNRGTVIICFRDITARMRLEELQAELSREASSRERFEGILGHDLRNPLSTITFAAAALIHGSGLAEPQARSIHRIASSASRMARMIDSLLDLTRSRGGGEIPIALQPVDLRTICGQVVDETEIANPKRRVELTFHGDTCGVWDPDRLAQVVSNLVGNALDYSAPDTAVTITARDEGGSVVLEVHNDGPPIPPDRLAELFLPFRRGEQASIDSRPTGLGLGLFITKLVVEAHGGWIEVMSAADAGTTFIVSLPRSPAEHAETATTPTP